MNPGMLRRLHRHDKIAAFLIKAGGVSIIASMIVMIVLLVKVSLPLFLSTKIDLHQTWEIPVDAHLVGVDDYGENAYWVNQKGQLSFYNLKDEKITDIIDLVPDQSNGVDQEETEDQGSTVSDTNADETSPKGGRAFHVQVTDNHIVGVHFGDHIEFHQIQFRPEFDKKGQRHIVHDVHDLGSFPSLSGDMNLPFGFYNNSDRALLLEHKGTSELAVTLKTKEEDLFGDVEEVVKTFSWESKDGDLTSFAIGENGSLIWVSDANGGVSVLKLQDDSLDFLGERDLQSPAKFLTPVLGRVSIAATTRAGTCETLMYVGDKIQINHVLARNLGETQEVIASMRHKVLIFLLKNTIRAIHMTSEKVLYNFSHPGEFQSISLTDRGGFLSGLDSRGQVWMWKVESPHPEISFKSLWRKVWYEGYKEPSYSWQSSSASDDFEPKMSLVPLVFGSLKGTFYGMIFALPLALFGALYTSQIMKPKWKKVVKPTIELMAAVPSVIVGFLGALWLAPIVEGNLLGIFLLPVALFFMAWMGGKIISGFQNRSGYEGKEFMWMIPAMLLGIVLAISLGHGMEGLLFGGDFKQWLFNHFQTQVDQRNSIVISFALGFAVIPVIFTIAEDAMSNVPQGMVAGSLALGANIWQTARRIVIPMASPGIFAAIMIGFGRAVGETMIVLMATGNTPIMDASVFNGMRTLAANIAVEIPEAPVDGSLYRLLFFSAFLLFLMTFAVNTLAEFVRSRLRRKYGQN